MPRLMTSIPAARLSEIRRSSSANMYGGIASRRREGAATPRLRVSGVALARSLRERLDQLRRELALEDRLRPTGEGHFELGRDLDLELAAVELDGERAARAS